MPDTGGSSWWAVVGWPAIAASVPGAIALWQWWGNLHDKRDARNQSTAERQQAALLADRELISKEYSDSYKRLEDELERAMTEKDRLRSQRRELERDRDRGWNIARFYHRLAGELLHALNNARFMADGLAGRSKPPIPPTVWKIIVVPDDLEAPFPRIDPPQQAD